MTPPPPTPDPTPKADSGAGDIYANVVPWASADFDDSTAPQSSTQPESEVKSCAQRNTPPEAPTTTPSLQSSRASNAAPPQSDPALAAAEQCSTCGGGGIISSGPRGERRYGGGRRCPTCQGTGKAPLAPAPAPEGRGETAEGDALFPTPGSVEWDEFIESHENLEEVLITAVISARRLERERDGLARWKEDHERILDLSNKFFREARRSVAHLLDDPQTGQEGICRNLLRIAAERDAAVAQAQALREAVAKIAGDGTWDTIMCDNDEQGCSCVEFATKTLKALAASEAGK